MSDFIVNNYWVLIAIAAFLILALIGFLVDQSKNAKSKEAQILTQRDEPRAQINIPEASSEKEEETKEEKEVSLPEPDSNQIEIPEAEEEKDSK